MKDIIYVLKLKNGRYYVGKTSNLTSRLMQHQSGVDSATWVKLHGYKSCVHIEWASGLLAEDNKTKELMMKYGIDNVRGGRYVTTELDAETKSFLSAEFNSAGGKCFSCGDRGHYVKDCKKKGKETPVSSTPPSPSPLLIPLSLAATPSPSLRTTPKTCDSITKSGAPCRVKAVEGSCYCHIHARNKESTASAVPETCKASTGDSPCGKVVTDNTSYCLHHLNETLALATARGKVLNSMSSMKKEKEKEKKVKKLQRHPSTQEEVIPMLRAYAARANAYQSEACSSVTCARCDRDSHSAINCHAYTRSDGSVLCKAKVGKYTCNQGAHHNSGYCDDHYY